MKQRTTPISWHSPWHLYGVEQNVAFDLDIKHVPKKQRDELVAKYLDIVGLTKYKSYYPKQLSSSMLQRVSIARAFATEPERQMHSFL